MTYYMRCKKWTEEQSGDEWGERDKLKTKGHYWRWEAWIGDIQATGRTRELACKRLWETLVELGLAEEAGGLK